MIKDRNLFDLREEAFVNDVNLVDVGQRTRLGECSRGEQKQ